MRFKGFIAILGILALAAGVVADVKYTTEMQMAQGMPAMKSTVYVKGQQERRDMNMMGMGEISTITTCEKRQVITVNWKCKNYFAAPIDPDNPDAAMPAPTPAGRSEPARKGGVVVIENDIRDTGERQKMFGLEARHVIVKMKMTPKDGACVTDGMEMEQDLWLVDMTLAQVNCMPNITERPPQIPAAGGCRDRFQMVNRGNAAAMRGLPVKSTMTMIQKNGQRQSFTTSITDLSTTTLEQSLFQPPADFKQAASQQEVYSCGMGIGNIAEAMKAAGRESRRAESEAAAASASTRRAGVPLIGVVMTDRARKVNTSDWANMLVGKIDAIEGFQGVRIDARDPAGIQKEATEKKCDFLLYAEVAELKTSGPRIGGLLGRAAGIGGGSTDPTQALKLDYRLTRVNPFDLEVAKEPLNFNEKGQIEAVSNTVTERTAERATGDARRWLIQNRNR